MTGLLKLSRIVAPALLIAAAGWIVYSTQFTSSPSKNAGGHVPENSALTASAQKVGIINAAPEKHQQHLIASCTTRADKHAFATARGAGVVTDLKVKRGSAVRAGDVIATISDEGRVAAVKMARALLQQRQADFEANKSLIEKSDVPRNTRPRFEAAVIAATAALAAAEAEWEKSNVRAPLDGIIESVPVEAGQAVQPGTQVAEVIGPDPMLAVGTVSERQRSRISIGQDAVVRFTDGETRNGNVSFVSLAADKATRTYRVEARLPNPDRAIADGVTCEMAVSLDTVDATAVPRSALILSDDGRLGVRIADDKSQAHFKPISIVGDGGDVIWVTGLDASSRVITVGQYFVKDGDPVEAVSAAAAAPLRPDTEPPG